MWLFLQLYLDDYVDNKKQFESEEWLGEQFLSWFLVKHGKRDNCIFSIDEVIMLCEMTC